MKNREILNTKEAAEYIRFSASSLNVWRTRNEGPRATNIRGKVFYFKDDLDSWLQEQREKAD
jgi:hypothetical protein